MLLRYCFMAHSQNQTFATPNHILTNTLKNTVLVHIFMLFQQKSSQFHTEALTNIPVESEITGLLSKSHIKKFWFRGKNYAIQNTFTSSSRLLIEWSYVGHLIKRVVFVYDLPKTEGACKIKFVDILVSAFFFYEAVIFL